MKTKDQLHLLYGAEEIAARIKRLAAQIQADYNGKEIFAVCVLKGAFMFFSDLVRHFGTDTECAFIKISSYGDGTKTSGEVKRLWDLSENVCDKHVLIVDDIVDSGFSLQYLYAYFTEKGAASVRSACLIDKPVARQNGVNPDYAAFTLREDLFVVGFGLDCAQKYRNLPDVCFLGQDSKNTKGLPV